MTTHTTIRRLRAVNPAAAKRVENDVLLTEIFAMPGDPRLADGRPVGLMDRRFIRARRNLQARPILAALVIGITLLCSVGAGIAASRLFKTAAQEEQGLTEGHAMFIGTHPTCTPVSDQQFRCVLKSAPTLAYIEGSYLGAKMQSVDANKRIDGGCIATSADGLKWNCYLGQAAVTHGILDPSVLGQYQPEPGHG